MATNLQTVFEFLNVTESLTTIDRKHLEEIRSAYDNGTETNHQERLKILGQTFMLVTDPENLDYLDTCVTSSSLEVACHHLLNKFLDKRTAENRNARKAKQAATTTTTTESVSRAICQIFIKQNQPVVIDFIHQFLLRPLLNAIESNNYDTFDNTDLPQGSVLDVFIRHQLTARDDAIDVGRQMSKFPLVNPITLVDEFDTWHFDHLHNLFELNLIPENSLFPHRWQLASDAQLFYRIDRANAVSNEESTVRNVDRPSTTSLEKFVRDVCEKENNGMATKWIDALRTDDIFTFDHLVNLKFTEWSELKSLSINGKKILKSYVDREKQMATDVKSSKNKEQTSTYSICELHANLHKIKLYFHHILADQFAAVRIPTPAKLDVLCVHSSFDEMRQDGFADDGLFDQMKIFFLPLTILEGDLSINDKKWRSISTICYQQRDELKRKKDELENELRKAEDAYYNHDESITKLRKEINVKKSVTNKTDEYETFSVSELLDQHRNAMEQLEQVRTDLRTRIKATEDLIRDIEFGLIEKDSNNTKRTNRDLIKPNRGFIMYGPPGTGKSDIMSTLSSRIGISMVAPPIAAGELNRPLVGESERIISDICMRCHRIPYLMCCVSIDEIDSLTPKRKDDSSDSNVAKLSVLLSVIDGIKDVPNLMIFCATNRLHMMDEAFLRRMQGKFFVGRPSSLARRSILSGIKFWHVQPYLLESLTMATTNFSGAALRALRRLITVHYLDAERANPHYKLDYRTMLQLADITARQYRVLIGAETLPTLLLRSADEVPLLPIGDQLPTRFNDLSDETNSTYTGKIIVNFHDNRIDIEAIHTHPKTGEIKKVVYQEHLLKSETDLQQLIERLTFYGKSRNVQLLQLIDLNLLSSESAYDEKDKFEILKERLDECAAYRRSMIVYDLDSLVGVNKSEGDSSMGRSTNLSLINHNIYTYIKKKFQGAHIESSSKTMNTTDDVQNMVISKEKWSVMIICDPFLLRQFYEDTKFTRSERELEQEKQDASRAEEKIKCVQCNDYYIEEDNKMGVCIHHDGFVYDNHSLTLDQLRQRGAIERLLKEEAEAVQQANRHPLTSEQKEKIERRKQRFKYICCNQTVQVHQAMGGCKKGKHSPRHMTINQWNTMCKNNQEYRQYRLDLLKRRTSNFDKPMYEFDSDTE